MHFWPLIVKPNHQSSLCSNVQHESMCSWSSQLESSMTRLEHANVSLKSHIEYSHHNQNNYIWRFAAIAEKEKSQESTKETTQQSPSPQVNEAPSLPSTEVGTTTQLVQQRQEGSVSSNQTQQHNQGDPPTAPAPALTVLAPAPREVPASTVPAPAPREAPVSTAPAPAPREAPVSTVPASAPRDQSSASSSQTDHVLNSHLTNGASSNVQHSSPQAASNPCVKLFRHEGKVSIDSHQPSFLHQSVFRPGLLKEVDQC